MSNIAELKNVPEISFIDGISLETVTSQMLADYAAAYAEAAGEQPELAQGSPERLLIGAMAVQYYQALQYIDRAGKMGLLKFSEGDYLDNIGVLRGIILQGQVHAFRCPYRAGRYSGRYTIELRQSVFRNR